MTYALIENGVVTNIFAVHPLNAGVFPDAVQTGELPVSIGDTYDNGVFYREGVRLKEQETADDEAEDMRKALEMLEVRANG